MSAKTRSNPLALAVLALIFERPMHPYEMAATLKHRHKHESIKLRYGTLYTVIELLTSRGLIRPKETSRDGKRPERTVYALTPAGRDLLRSWMRDLIAQPAKEFVQFEAALSLLPVLPPDEAVAMLRERVQRLSENLTQMQALAGQLSDMTLGELAEPNQDLPAPLLGQKFPAIFMVESEYRSALLKAEIDFVNDLVRRITEEGWGPVEVWRGMQAHCEQGYQRENESAVRDDADG
ncbi:PadR family transcripitonal regulator [Afipia sp. P52-10]|uniref:PadR family transcriptional regulator n=1 Tax=Afipia sp. P52-10 TaxID=1429916 RepID=UPI0003DF2AB2|nr:PadR family transcriptional regulator [Afipia sp. P52-10]ETR75613.1 PadR family transcripitonal regulator [Afipia sp. P52-10]